MLNFIKNIRLHWRAGKRFRMFQKGLNSGMSVDEARTHSDNFFPPTDEDLEFEKKLKDETLY